ncbi:glycerophosphodiester phosphodiesterase [Pseudalkalibacillus hwajinpoensis]|uniref:Glycerophosphodiester phosphodiesterase n=1 Tax=Guptibacillus hwajinpoensis TaxID=208199 RepID=A0A4U1MF32_9BACL|nr:glycerophosphodiester phosphodiesterase [Pseudalkalibacillus hwajinpoensis]TKD68836.1 glycerophosphodiester phosphodiesterase [Pseudalkalibacillus hwajinpoensis]
MASLTIFGHRGSSGTHPENTLISFQAANKAGANGIELDVQLTKDGIPVVIHDERVDRTTNGVGWVKDFLYEDLIRLDAGQSFSSRFQGTPIPSLDEVLEWITSTTLSLNIELKTGYVSYEGIEDKILALLNHYQLKDRCIISSFNHYSVKHITQTDSPPETAILIMEKLVEPWDYLKKVGAHGLHIEWQSLDEDLMHNTQKRGIPVRAFTVNDQKEILKAQKLGCDAIFTDFPASSIQSF